MEILLTSLGVLTILVLVVLVGTGGQPLKVIVGFRETV